MRTLKATFMPEAHHEVRQSDPEKDYWCLYYNGECTFLVMVLVKENNRGWTFVNHALTGNKTTFFFSRGDFEMVEE